jgi:hypothetical protein
LKLNMGTSVATVVLSWPPPLLSLTNSKDRVDLSHLPPACVLHSCFRTASEKHCCCPNPSPSPASMVRRPQTKSRPQGPLPSCWLNHMDVLWSPVGHRLSDRVREERFTAELGPRDSEVTKFTPHSSRRHFQSQDGGGRSDNDHGGIGRRPTGLG